jgi:uncharacterized protein YkwD
MITGTGRIRATLVSLCVVTLGSGLAADGKPSAKDKLSADEQKLLELTNQERKKEKLPLLRPNPVLFTTARAHAANMARQKKMLHVLDGKNVYERLDKAGYDWALAGENLGRTKDASLEDLMQGWMKSKGHRKNILKDRYTEVGIGIASDGQERVYYAMVFGHPKKKAEKE